MDGRGESIVRKKSARYFGEVAEEDKREPAETFMRSVELEFEQKRARWERDRARHRAIRLISFSAISVLILAALVALFLAFSRANEMRSTRSPAKLSGSPAPSPFP